MAIENKNNNIIVKKDKVERERGRAVARDGVASPDSSRKEDRDNQIECLKKHLDDLRKRRIKCSLRIIPDKKPCIVGSYKRNPFAVYVNLYHEGQEFAGVVVTRFKGVDIGAVPPYKVLRKCAT